jgi:hypothetical protein
MMNTTPTLLTRPIKGVKLGNTAQASGVLRGPQHSSAHERQVVEVLSADCFELLRTLSTRRRSGCCKQGDEASISGRVNLLDPAFASSINGATAVHSVAVLVDEVSDRVRHVCSPDDDSTS